MLSKIDWPGLSRAMIPNFALAFLLTACGGGSGGRLNPVVLIHSI